MPALFVFGHDLINRHYKKQDTTIYLVVSPPGTSAVGIGLIPCDNQLRGGPMKPVIAWLMLVLIGTAGFGRQGYPQSLENPTPEDAKSLRLFYTTMLRAYQRGHTDEFHQLVNKLELPDKGAWIQVNFQKDQATELSAQYAASFQEFTSRLAKNFGEALSPGSDFKIDEHKNTGRDVHALPGSSVPKTDLLVKSYKFVLTVPGTGRIEWMDSFAHVDGALRFIGQGAFPFWSGTRIIRVQKVTSRP